jgi:hypothetical protein
MDINSLSATCTLFASVTECTNMPDFPYEILATLKKGAEIVDVFSLSNI